jgi:hypothetical protein
MFNRSIIVIAFLIATGLSACKEDSSTSIQNQLIENYVNHGKWRVELFQDKGNNETSHFSGYVFQFKTDGTVEATNGGSTMKGTWSTGTDNNKTKLNLSFSTAPMDELNGDWVIKSGDANSIRLEDESDDGISYLNFEKI